jgi:membrane protein implicated in regulation of membrane protease activity
VNDALPSAVPVPLAGLLLFAVLPFPAALTLYLALTIPSLAIAIPAVRAMYQVPTTGAEAMRGKEGVVVTAEGRTGLVRYGGELWSYEAPEPLAPGDQVRIVELVGLTAAVRPAPQEDTQGSKGVSG